MKCVVEIYTCSIDTLGEILNFVALVLSAAVVQAAEDIALEGQFRRIGLSRVYY
jgi:hypothetical protein